MNKLAQRNEALETLRHMLKPGDAIRCTVMHVSKSGMSRTIMLQVALLDENKQPYIRDISYLVAQVIGVRYDQSHGGVLMTGCGTDMRFEAVYNLGRSLFLDGFGVIGVRYTMRGKRVEKRATTPASARHMKRIGYTFRGRNCDESGWDTDGGYALDYRG